MVAITNVNNEEKLRSLLEERGVPASFSCYAQGTAPSAIMDIFGLSGRNRILTAGIILRSEVKALFDRLSEGLSFMDKGTGIAFTISLTGIQRHILDALKNSDVSNEEEDGAMNENAYSAIFASVEKGYSEDVFEAARSAGATGGTIIQGMRDVGSFFSESESLPLREEQDFILIITKRDKKKEIMTAIMEKCGLSTNAHGVVVSLPIDEVFGLN